MDELSRHFDNMDNYHNQLAEEFRRLAAEPCGKVPQVGDRVLVCAGLVNRGHLWIRLEGVVLEVGDTSYKVRFVGRAFRGEEDECWCHQFTITDVLSESRKD